MAYDYQKVRAWLASVAAELAMPLFLELHGIACDVGNEERAILHERIKEAKRFTTWERVNACYGLRDLINIHVDTVLQGWSAKARREDDANDPELQRILRERMEKAATSTQNLPDCCAGCDVSSQCVIMASSQPEVCSVCKQPFVHHQHPMKPPGVIMCSTCGCTPPAEKVDGT